MTIRPVSKNGQAAFMLDAGTIGGRRRRFFFPTKREAEKKRDQIAQDRRAVGAAWADIAPRDRARVVAVLGEMEAKGLTLDAVWRAYQSGTAGKAVQSRTIGEVIAELIDAKRKSKRRENYIGNLKSHLADFAKGREGAAIASVGLTEVEAYLDKAKSSGSRMTRLNRLSTLLSFAVKRGYLASNPADASERVQHEYRTPEILTVQQCHALLEATREHDPRFLPHIVLCLFAGVRPGEAARIKWADVDLTTGLLTVDAEDSKTRSRRIVELPSACVAWLKLGGDLPAKGVRYRLEAVAVASGIQPWPRDCLRHTAASNWHAHRDAGIAARNMGHSEAVFHQHYKALITPAQAAAFFGLMP